MGISGLQKSLEPYARPSNAQELDGYVAVIDGPGLAYHAYNLAAAAEPVRLPSYRDINAIAIRWLKSLEDDSSIKVSAILFDGALPTRKRKERHERVQQNLQRVLTFRFNNGADVCPVPRYLGSVLYPLLAPALREALLGSLFAAVTRMVPGEADDWLAASTKGYSRSVVFTSDTDLLLYEYGDEVLVSFFRDTAASLTATFTVYSPTDICSRLKLTSLLCLAHALEEDHSRYLSENLQKAQDVDTTSATYLEFSGRYTGTVQSLHRCTILDIEDPVLQGLDVRVSELLHQASISGNKDLTPEIYLPGFLEDTKKASAWNFARDIRLLAYTLLVPVGCSMVREYTRRGQNPAPSDHQTYSESEARAKLSELSLAAARHAANADNSAPLPWFLLATQLALRDLKPPYAFVLARIFSERFDQTWAYVHLHAIIAATLYSLRILKQCMSVWITNHRDRGHGSLYEDIKKLHGVLDDLPTIADSFSVPGQNPATDLDESVIQDAIRDLYTSIGIDERGLFGEAKSKRQRKREKREKRAQHNGQRKTVPSLGGNSFAILGPG